MGMKAGGSDDLNSEINVTPMVDVMLVLLVIFMVTAPMMNTGVSLDLPQVTAQKLEDPEGKLVLSITKDRKLYLGGSAVSWLELKVKLETNERVQKEDVIHVEADSTLPYAVVVTAMAVAKDAGVAKVLLLTDPTTNMRLEDLDLPPATP